MTSPAWNVVHGRMVLEETPDFLARRSAIAARFTPSTCRKCGGTDFAHDGMCPNWLRALGASSPRWWFDSRVVAVVRQRMLMQSLRESLAGEPKDAKALRAEWLGCES